MAHGIQAACKKVLLDTEVRLGLRGLRGLAVPAPAELWSARQGDPSDPSVSCIDASYNCVFLAAGKWRVCVFRGFLV